MAITLFSVFYPHEKRFELIRDGFLPFLGKIKYHKMDYFLSTYKGENITMSLDTSNREMKTLIKNHFRKFFADNSIEAAEKKLPINQFFLDFKPNALHIWEFNPFKNKQRDLENLTIQKKECELSNKCLHFLSINQLWDRSESVQFYIDILIIIDCLLHFDSMVPTSFLNTLQLNLKSKFNRNVYLYQEYLKDGQGIYTSNRHSVIQHYEYIKTIVKSAEVKNSDLSEWVSLVKKWMVSSDSHNQISLVDQCVSLIFSINQKIDLNPEGLVIAFGILQRLNEERIL